MSTKVEVLCPNGHRVSVKITPNTKLLHVLEEACCKKGFQPPEHYQLKHGRKDLDLTLTARFAGLPNLAKLELVKASKSRLEVDTVTIAIQLEDGNRLQENLPSSMALWDILKYWENKEDSKFRGRLAHPTTPGCHPVCVYMQEEIAGEFALKEVTLKKLGLTSGRAIIRLLHRPVDSKTLEETKINIMKEKERLSKLSKMQCNVIERGGEMQVMCSAVDLHLDTPTESDHALSPLSEPPTQNSSESMECVMTSDPIPEAMEVGSDAPTDGGVLGARCDDTQTTNANSIPGVEVFRPGEAQLTVAERLQLAQYLSQIQTPPMSSTQHASAKVDDFSDFKFPEETKGKAVYHNEFQESSKEDFKPCLREAVMYSVDKKGPPVLSHDPEDVTDDFFELTENDLKVLWTDQQKKTAAAADQPLMTKAMKQALMEESLSKYSRVILRFHFPEKVVLQALFRPRETVFAIQKFVKENLDDPDVPFYLYTTPPKQVLADQACTLMAASLVPMSVVYFGSDVKKDFYLSRTLLQNMSNEREAIDVMMKHIQPTALGQRSAGASSSSSKRSGLSQGASSQRATGSSASSSGNLPKWFRVGKK